MDHEQTVRFDETEIAAALTMYAAANSISIPGEQEIARMGVRGTDTGEGIVLTLYWVPREKFVGE